MNKRFYHQVGLDLHKNRFEVAVASQGTTTCKQLKIPNNPQMLDIFFYCLYEPVRVALESTRDYYRFAADLNERKNTFYDGQPLSESDNCRSAYQEG